MEPTSLQDALDYCLENPDNLSAQELLDRFPEYRDELVVLLDLAGAIQAAPPPVPAARRAAMKARVVAAAAALRPTQELTPATPAATGGPVAVPRRTSGPVPVETYTKRPTPLLLRPGFITAAAAALIVAFVWWSSLGALPDSPFYNVRIAGENVAISLAGSDADQASAHLDAATSRLYDLREMQQRGRLAEAQEAVVNYEQHLSSAEALWQRTSPPSVRVAEQLYVTSVAGRATFDRLGTALTTLPGPYRQDIADAQAANTRASTGAEQALVQAGRDPAAVLAEAARLDSNLAGLVTPVIPTLPVPTEPVVPSTATGSNEDATTPTVVAVQPAIATATATATATPTATPVPPTAPPTATATDTPASVEPPRATPSPPRATPSPPRATPSPPRATPSVPPAPPATHTPRPVPPTRTPQPLPTSTRTPVLVAANVCDLSVRSIAVTCREQGGVNWFAVVNNSESVAVTASWVAQLEVKNQDGGGFAPVMSVSGTDVFAPGSTILNRTILYTFGPEADKARVILRLDTSGYACTVPAKQSLDVSACNSQNPENGGGKPDKTRTPPGLENKPTERPKVEPEPPDPPGGPGPPSDPGPKQEPRGPASKP